MELASERVIIEAPMSFVGSAKRIWRFWKEQLARVSAAWYALPTKAILYGFVILTIAFAWTVVLLWYLTFGLLLTPYRLIRRSSRKQKRDALRHRETMEAIAHK